MDVGGDGAGTLQTVPARSTGVRRNRLVAVIVAVAVILAVWFGAPHVLHRRKTDEATPLSRGPHVVTIGVLVPLTGPHTAAGMEVRDAVQAAVAEVGGDRINPTWRLAVRVEDDGGTPDTGVQAATRLAADPTVAAVVGPLDAEITRRVAPIFARGRVVLVAPGGSDADVTRGGPGLPHRMAATLFRVVPNDDGELPFLAEYSRRTLGVSAAALVTDGTPAAATSAGLFRRVFEQAGGTIAVEDRVDPAGGGALDEIAAHLAGAQPGLVLVLAPPAAAGALAAADARHELHAPVAGGAALLQPAFVNAAGAAAEGTLAVAATVPPGRQPRLSRLLDEYGREGRPADLTGPGPYAFDAAGVVLDALAAELAGRFELGPATRTAILGAVQHTQREGVTGPVRFDAFGDTTNRAFTVWRVTGGSWKDVDVGTAPEV